MKINKLLLENFRNYSSLDIDFSNDINIIYGANAQGKTSILESFYYLSLLSSYRSHYDADLIKHNCEKFIVAAEYSDNDKKNSIKVLKSILNKKRVCSVNNVDVSTRDFIGELKVVSFSPDDLEIIKGEPAIRRRFINIQLSRINKYYYNLLVKFNAILKQRNKLLKDIKEKKYASSTLEAWDYEYTQISLEIINQRRVFFENFIPDVQIFFAKQVNVSRETLTCEYKTNYILDNELSKQEQINNFLLKLKSLHDVDIKKGCTSVGPHKDDFIFSINGYESNKFASQGQQRSIILALKLAEINYIIKHTSEYPVLLLDDVLSELDDNKKKNFLFGLDKNLQIFITVTELDLLPNDFLHNNSKVDVFEIKNAQVEKKSYG